MHDFKKETLQNSLQQQGLLSARLAQALPAQQYAATSRCFSQRLLGKKLGQESCQPFAHQLLLAWYRLRYLTGWGSYRKFYVYIF